MNLNEQGQEFIGYRLIIGALIAFFILVIILGAINYFSSIKTEIATDALDKGINAAKASPNGDIIKKPSIALNASAISKRFFSLKSGLDEECIQLRAPDRPGGSIFVQNDNMIVITQPLETDLYFRCVTCKHKDAFESDCEKCEINCWASVGKSLKQEFGIE